MKKIALLINVCADDCTVERAIIASNAQHDLLLSSNAEKTSYALILQLCKVCL